MGRSGEWLGLTWHPELQGQQGKAAGIPWVGEKRSELIHSLCQGLPKVLCCLCVFYMCSVLNHESLEPLNKGTGKPRQCLSLQSSQKSTFAGISFCRDLSPTEVKMLRSLLCVAQPKVKETKLDLLERDAKAVSP